MKKTAALAVLLALVAGCQSADHSAAPPVSDQPPPLVPALPLPDNAVDNAVAKLDGIAEELMKSSGIPGMAVAVVHGGKTVYAKGFGVKDVRAGDEAANKVDTDTVFQLASLSKPLAASVVAHQVGVDAISWDTPLVEKLPWFALSDPAVTTAGSVVPSASAWPKPMAANRPLQRHLRPAASAPSPPLWKKSSKGSAGQR